MNETKEVETEIVLAKEEGEGGGKKFSVSSFPSIYLATRACPDVSMKGERGGGGRGERD